MDNQYLDKIELELLEQIRLDKERQRKLSEIALELKIPLSNPTNYSKSESFVSMKDLWDIFSDENKFKDLTSRLKLKAFW
jgi:hypothetical protein